MFSTLQGDITDATAFGTALKQLTRKGLNGAAFADFAQNADLAEAQALAGMSAKDARRYEWLYNRRQPVTGNVGSYAGTAGTPIAEARIFTEATPHVGARLRAPPVLRQPHRAQQGAKGHQDDPTQPEVFDHFTATLVYYAAPAKASPCGRKPTRWTETILLDSNWGDGTQITRIYGVHHIAKELQAIRSELAKADHRKPRHVIVEGYTEGEERVDREHEERLAYFRDAEERNAARNGQQTEVPEPDPAAKDDASDAPD